MIQINLAETGYQATAQGNAVLQHNAAERLAFTGKAFDEAHSYQVMLAQADGTHLALVATGTVSGGGLYVYADLDLRTAEIETALGTAAYTTAFAWLYDATDGNYLCYVQLTVRRSPEPTGVTVTALPLPIRFSDVSALPTGASIRTDTVYRLDVADGGKAPGFYMHDGSAWVVLGLSA